MRYIYLSFLLLLAVGGMAQGPVIPDVSFNGTGQSVFKVNNSESSYGSEVKVLPDGKILMSGVYKNGGLFEIAVVKFNSDGYSLDPTFGVNGVATASMGNTATTGGLINHLKIDPSGRIFVSGYGYTLVSGDPAHSSYDLFLSCFLPNGTLDPSFDLDGRVFVNVLGSPDRADQLLDFTFDAVGNIYMTGSTDVTGNPPGNEIVIVKLTPSGAFDLTFSGDGKQLYTASAEYNYGYGIAVQPDGKIIVSGNTLLNSNFFALRVNADGTTDNTFGTSGLITVDIFASNAGDPASCMLLQTNGKILIAGAGTNPTSAYTLDAAIVRLNQNGSLDNTFGGGDGIFTYDMSGTASDDLILKMKLLANGQIICSGYGKIAGQKDFAVIRVNRDGTIDNTFNNSGKYLHDLTGTSVDDECRGIDVQPDNKLILGGKTSLIESVYTRFSIMRLIPDKIVANFSATPTTLCAGNTVQFTDNSGSPNLQWHWTFYGGTPATSTLQNPLITYSTTGSYNVKLVVNNAFMTDSLIVDNMITVYVTPVAPTAPTGPAAVCGSSSSIYSTTSVPMATSYNWVVEPAAAGALVPAGTNVTFNASSTYVGPFTIKVSAQNICGSSPFVQKVCQLNHAPSVYLLTGAGYYCQGTTGQTLMLSNSDIGVNYELTLNGTPTGNIKAGTGSSIAWNNIIPEGFYMVQAFNGCLVGMAGQVYNVMFTPPAQASTPAGLTQVCNGTTNGYTTTAVASALSYQWTLSPANAGIITANGLQASIVWNSSFTGTANLSVMAVNECGNGPASSTLAISVNTTPAPSVSGFAIVCKNWNAVYETAAHTGSTYVWTVTGGTIVSGAGTASLTVNWNTTGTGTLKVVETSVLGCVGTSSLYNVTVNACVGMEELTTKGTFSVFPNPVQNRFTVKLNEKAGDNSQLRIIEATGRVVAAFPISKNCEVIEGIDISNLKSGFYYLQMVNNGKVVSYTKIIKQ
jgi:uncharacterized delta-60 repeat protein